MQILLSGSRTQVGPGRTGKKEQEQNSRNHAQAFLLVFVHKRDFLLYTVSVQILMNLLLAQYQKNALSEPLDPFAVVSRLFRRLCDATRGCALSRMSRVRVRNCTVSFRGDLLHVTT